MHDAAAFGALATAALNTVAALFGAWRWWTVSPSKAFWVLARAGQVLAIGLAALAGVLALTGFEPADGLFWLYALLPVAVSFVAEQLRLASAQNARDGSTRYQRHAPTTAARVLRVASATAAICAAVVKKRGGTCGGDH